MIIGIVFVVARIIKANKPSPNANKRPRRPAPGQGGRPTPQSFEDILKEFGEKVDGQHKPAPRPVQERPKAPERRPDPVRKFAREGEERKFADDESRRIYEEAIVRSEGYDIKFGEDINFGSKRTIFGEGAVRKEKRKKNPLAKEIRTDLKNKSGLKKAFVLSEILNRRY